MIAIQVAEQLSHVVSKDGEALPLFDINFHEHFIILVLQILQHMLIDMLQNYLLEVLTEILSFVKLVTNLKEDHVRHCEALWIRVEFRSVEI